jgi:beta-lactamase superfamily II metal-dependent hydrolase
MDHMSGLHRFFWQEAVSLENFWDVSHNKKQSEADFEHSPYAYEDWLVYRLLRDGGGPNDSKHKVITNVRGDRGQFWTDDGIEVLSPTNELIRSCNADGSYNDCSYVLKITYAGRVVILPGDAEGPSWTSMLKAFNAGDLKCDVLKASHHGRYSGYDKEAVQAMSPDIVVCSVGKKPETDASQKYASQGAQVLSTRYNGTITVSIKENGKVVVRDHSQEKIGKIDRLY